MDSLHHAPPGDMAVGSIHPPRSTREVFLSRPAYERKNRSFVEDWVLRETTG
jgi:hypothetical protein